MEVGRAVRNLNPAELLQRRAGEFTAQEVNRLIWHANSIIPAKIYITHILLGVCFEVGARRGTATVLGTNPMYEFTRWQTLQCQKGEAGLRLSLYAG